MDRFIFASLFSALGVVQLSAQHLKIESLLEDNISIRAITVSNDKVYYSGTNSKIGYVSLSHPLDKKQIVVSDKNLQFRTIGEDKENLFTISIESPAYFYKINKLNLVSTKIAEDDEKHAFYDALHFYKENKAITFSDPEDDQFLKLQYYKNHKWQRQSSNLKLAKGEAAFAASNSNITSQGSWIWLVTGGKEANVYKICKKNPQKIYKYNTPIVQGESAQGIYSVDFYNAKLGIVAGGDYTKPNLNTRNIATTVDGGKTWTVQASGNNAGYTTFVGFQPKSKGKIIVAVGDQHISLSTDQGKSWTKISDEKGFYTAKWLNKNQLVLAGKNRIVKATIIY